MLISAKKIIGLPVYTVSGARLGKVADINVDAEAHAAANYAVSAGLIGKQVFLVRPAQVRGITAEKMTVDDAFIKELPSKREKKMPAPVLENVAAAKE